MTAEHGGTHPMTSPLPRILLINPNSSAATTAMMVATEATCPSETSCWTVSAPPSLPSTLGSAASAGDTLRVIIEFGKFHGVMAPQTPIGCRIASRRASARWVGMVSP